MEKDWTTNSRDWEALEALRAEDSERHGGRLTRPGRSGRPPLRGWAIWVASVLVIVALLVAGLAWVPMGVAWFVPFSVGVTVLVLMFAAPLVGGALALPGVMCALAATWRARKTGARLGAPVTLVWLATALLVTGLLFASLVAYPRYQLGVFAQALQAHCMNVRQVLRKYEDLSPSDWVSAAPGIVADVQQNQRMLQEDQDALHALSVPDNLNAQMLLEDCQAIIDGTLNLPTLLKQPSLGSVGDVQALYLAYHDAVQRGHQLEQDLFAPFQPPPDLQSMLASAIHLGGPPPVLGN